MKYINAYNQVKAKLDDFMQIFDNCIESNALNKFDYTNLMNASKHLSKLESEGQEIHDKFSTILEDLFYILYKIDPEYREDGTMDKTAGYFNRTVMQHIQGLSRYQELRIYTKLDELNTGVGMVAFGSEVKELVEEQKKMQDELQDLLSQISDGMGSGGGDQDLPQDLQDKLDDFLDKHDQNIQNLMPDLSDLAATMDAVVEMTEENDDIAKKWGLEQNDKFQKLPYSQKVEVFEKLRDSNKLADMAKKLGKFTSMLNSDKATKISKKISNSQKISFSDEIQRALPLELLRFADEDFEDLFLNDLANQCIQSYDYDLDNEDIKGPIVIAIDESGSMGGFREIWSKALALAVTHQAKIENRSVFVIHFAHHFKAEKLKVNVFPKNQSLDIKEVIDMAEHFYNGGTSFEQPLERSMQCINTEEEFHRADILFITDGECAVSKKFLDKFNAWKKERNVMLYSISVGGGYGRKTLGEFSNSVIEVNELTDDIYLKAHKKLIQ